ncbi:MAG: helix-turn-helix transcriptional regulator [Pannonibacter sp.]
MTQPDNDPRDALVDSLYAAVNAPATWPDAAARIGEELGGTAYLFEFSASGRHTGRYCSPEQALMPLQLLVALKTGSGRSMLGFMLNEAELQTPYCKQALTSQIDDLLWAGPDNDLVQTHGLLAAVRESGGGRDIFMLLSTPGSPGLAAANFPFTRRLLRALGQALDLSGQRRSHMLDLQRQRMLMRHDGGNAILIDEMRRVVATTPGGIEALAAADLFDTRSGRLQIVPKDVDELLDELLEEVRQNDRSGPPPAILIRDSLHSRFDGALCRFVLRTVWPVPGLDVEPSDGHVLITLREAPAISREARDALQSVFGLSKSEARLAYYLAMTGSLTETLETLCITRNTGKTHLRRIFEKTGAGSQTELYQLMFRISALY